MPHSLSNTFLRLAALAALIGMFWGNVMGATHDYTTSTAHAHLNLLGWVSMALYGLFYRVLPHAAVGRLPKIHLWLSVLSLLVMIPTLFIVRINLQPAASYALPMLILASVTMFLSMVVFVFIVFKSTTNAASQAAVP